MARRFIQDNAVHPLHRAINEPKMCSILKRDLLDILQFWIPQKKLSKSKRKHIFANREKPCSLSCKARSYNVYLGWSIAPSHIQSKWGGNGGIVGSQPMSAAVHITWHGAQMNFRDLTTYLTYGVKNKKHDTGSVICSCKYEKQR